VKRTSRSHAAKSVTHATSIGGFGRIFWRLEGDSFKPQQTFAACQLTEQPNEQPDLKPDHIDGVRK
jgi:hypothetical protein